MILHLVRSVIAAAAVLLGEEGRMLEESPCRVVDGNGFIASYELFHMDIIGLCNYKKNLVFAYKLVWRGKVNRCTDEKLK